MPKTQPPCLPSDFLFKPRLKAEDLAPFQNQIIAYKIGRKYLYILSVVAHFQRLSCKQKFRNRLKKIFSTNSCDPSN